MSALAHLASSSTLKTESPCSTTLFLPDGTEFEVHLSPSESCEGRVEHILNLKTRTTNDWIDDQGHLTVQAPLPPYPASTAEPDDNTLATRSKRFATLAFMENTHKFSNSLSQAKAWNWLHVFFALWPLQEYVVLHTVFLNPIVVEYLLSTRLATLSAQTQSFKAKPYSERRGSKVTELLISRAAFWQGLGSPKSHFAPWILPLAPSTAIIELSSSNSETIRTPFAAPFKPCHSDGPIYSRYITGIESMLTFRIVSASEAKDVDLITEWHASDRVNDGWRQRLSRDEQIKTIQATENDPYSIGLIGEWDGKPWGYIEIYYAKQSNLKNFYDANQFDRGFHALVGDEKFRGPHRVRSWMGSVVHLMFLLHPSTALGVSEPRLSNTKMIAYEEMVGGNVEKYIDFEHKRAALVFFSKERFFQLCPMDVLPEHKHLA